MKLALITCSYRPDFERCKTLCASVDRFVPAEMEHVLLVPRRDRALFGSLAGTRTRVIDAESLLPWWIRRVPVVSKWWLTMCSAPVRGWIMQQIVKLSAPFATDADVLIYADSDCAFIRPFTAAHIVRDDMVRLLRIPEDGRYGTHFRWHRRAAQLLGLPPRDYFGSDYIAPLVSWRRDVVLKLHERLREIAGRAWQVPLCQGLHLSEYILYGVFVEQVLEPPTGHWYDAESLCRVAWSGQIGNDEELVAFFASIEPQQVAIQIQSNLGIETSRYETLLQQTQNGG